MSDNDMLINESVEPSFDDNVGEVDIIKGSLFSVILMEYIL